MPLVDHGGFDLTIEIATPALAAAIGSGFNPNLANQTVQLPGVFSGELQPQAQVFDVTLNTARDITIDLNLNGTVLQVTQLAFVLPGVGNPPPPWLANIPIGGVVQITDRLEMQGNALVVDFTNTAILNQPNVQVQLDENVILAAPLVQFILAQAFINGGQAGYQQTRQTLLNLIVTFTQDAVRPQVLALGSVELASAPTDVPVTASTLLTGPASLHLLYTLSGPPEGNPALITRSMLLTSSVTGLPVDAAAFCLSNTSLLRDFVRPALVGALGIPLPMFNPEHPCQVIGSFMVMPGALGAPPPGIASVIIECILTGVDEAGSLNITTYLIALGVADAFNVRATVNTTFSINPTIADGTLTLTVTPFGAPSVSSEVVINAWVYVAAAFTGSAALLGILAVIDVFGGQLLNGAITSAITSALPAIAHSVPLPTRLPALAIRTIQTTHADAVRGMIFIPGLWIQVPDPFRSHDLIINFV